MDGTNESEANELPSARPYQTPPPRIRFKTRGGGVRPGLTPKVSRVPPHGGGAGSRRSPPGGGGRGPGGPKKKGSKKISQKKDPKNNIFPVFRPDPKGSRDNPWGRSLGYTPGMGGHLKKKASPTGRKALSQSVWELIRAK